MRTSSILLALVPMAACHDDGHVHNPEELITTVSLSLTPMPAGVSILVEFDDPDGDGGDPPMIDPLSIAPGMYDVAVGFENRLETPPEIITDEVRDEAEDHQVFFTGTAIGGAIAHTYQDMDGNGLPIGLANRFVTTAGTGDLVVTLRHMPPIDGNPVKDGTRMAGDVDAMVTFPVTVQ